MPTNSLTKKKILWFADGGVEKISCSTFLSNVEIFKTDDTNAAAGGDNSQFKPVTQLDYKLNIPSDSDMDQNPPKNKKRDVNLMNAQELQWKLKSK